jgi:hypothetical protein
MKIDMNSLTVYIIQRKQELTKELEREKLTVNFGQKEHAIFRLQMQIMELDRLAQHFDAL